MTDRTRRVDEGISVTHAMQSVLRVEGRAVPADTHAQMVKALRRMTEYCKEHPEVVDGCEAVQEALKLLQASPDVPSARAQVLSAVDALAESLAVARLRFG